MSCLAEGSRRRVHVVLLAGLGAAALAPAAIVGCGGGERPAASARASVGGGADAGGAARPAAPRPSPSPPAVPIGSVQTSDPNAISDLLAAAAAAGPARLAPMGPGDAVAAGISAGAARYAPGMTPEGDMAKASLAEGGHVGFVFQMDPRRCYTIVGFGEGVTDLDLSLLAPPFYNLLAGQDGTAGATAVIGAAPKPMCPMAPIAVPYKIDIYAKKGGGLVGAQVYSKPK